MALGDLNDWLSERTDSRSFWYLKRLSGNDTLANGSHQAGPYIPKDLLFELFPSIRDASTLNPRIEFDVDVDSHAEHKRVTAIWYNNHLHGGTRNETRVTNWGGSSSAVLTPESTGALTAFAFSRPASDQPVSLHVWVCRNAFEEDVIEERISPVEPGEHVIWRPGEADIHRVMAAAPAAAMSCSLTPAQMPPGWLTVFPSGADIVRKVCQLRPADGASADSRLIRRRDCEYEVFQSVEQAIEGSVISHGFHSIADFLTTAQRVLQRRKARSGKSLELQMKQIFLEEGLVAGQDFSHNPESESGKRPDFLFPSQKSYQDPDFDVARLRMLATKTTCKDRWRQVINEADRIAVKHLLTLQEGVSLRQYAEMKDAGIRLVIPTPLIKKYPESVQPDLMTVEAFVSSIRHLAPAR